MIFFLVRNINTGTNQLKWSLFIGKIEIFTFFIPLIKSYAKYSDLKAKLNGDVV